MGLTENPCALKRWTIAGSEQARILTELEDQFMESKKDSHKHHEQTPSKLLHCQQAFKNHEQTPSPQQAFKNQVNQLSKGHRKHGESFSRKLPRVTGPGH